jgi:ectoine hydroxylase
MTPEQILPIPPRVLSQCQRERYFEDGCLRLEGIVSPEWLAKLRAATQDLVERSRMITKSDAVFDLEPDHTPQNPRLRRVSSPVDQHPAFWDYVA